MALKFLKLRQDCWIYFSTGLLGLRNVLRNEERKKLWRNNMLSKVKLKSLRDEVIDTSIATLRKYILRFFGNFTIPAEEFKLWLKAVGKEAGKENVISQGVRFLQAVKLSLTIATQRKRRYNTCVSLGISDLSTSRRTIALNLFAWHKVKSFPLVVWLSHISQLRLAGLPVRLFSAALILKENVKTFSEFGSQR